MFRKPLVALMIGAMLMTASSCIADDHTFEKVVYAGDGIAAVLKDGERYFIDAHGNLSEDCPQYDWNFEVYTRENGGTYLYKLWDFGDIRKDETGQVTGYWAWNDKNEIYLDLYDGLASFGLRKYDNEAEKNVWKVGFVDSAFRMAVPFEYEYADDFSEGLAAVCYQGKWGYIDTTGEAVIAYQYDDAMSFTGGLAAVCQKDGDTERWGYIDATGETVIPLQYGGAAFFIDGLGAVRDGDAETGLWGLIDRSGELVVPYAYPNRGDDRLCPFFEAGEGLIGVIADDGETQTLGYLNSSGEEIVPCIYQYPEFDYYRLTYGFETGFGHYRFQSNGDIYGFEYRGQFGCFHDGLARVCNENGYGFIDASGSGVIPCQFEGASDFRSGLALIVEDRLYGIIDTSGQIVAPCEYGYLVDRQGDSLTPSFDEYLEWFEKDKKFGAIDIHGNLAIPCEYDWVYRDFHEGDFTRFDPYRWVEKDGKHGVVSMLDGHWIAPCIFDDYGDFEEGLSWVHQDGVLCLLDEMGNIAEYPQWSRADAFHEGFAWVYSGGEALGFVNTQGAMVASGEWTDCTVFSDGLAKVAIGPEDEQKWGVIDTEGNMIVPCEYDSIQGGDGCFFLVNENRLTIIDTQGNVLF